MGDIWRARLEGSRGIGQDFAIKVLRSDLTSSPSHVAELVEEARVVSHLRSPFVAQLVELLELDPTSQGRGGVALVLEWVDGVPLSLAIQGGRTLSLGVALRIAADACAGLHAAHELRDANGHPLDLVHRDVSPQNVLVGRNGCVKVVDFGIAKAKGRGVAETTTGTKGKLFYMSREQANSEPLDRRADVFSLGVMLYEMLCGTMPFAVQSDMALLSALLAKRDPAPLPASVPAMVRAIVRRALAHEKQKRFATALELRSALEDALMDCNVPTDAEKVAKAFAPFMPAPTVAALQPATPPTPAQGVPSRTNGTRTARSSVVLVALLLFLFGVTASVGAFFYVSRRAAAQTPVAFSVGLISANPPLVVSVESSLPVAAVAVPSTESPRVPSSVVVEPSRPRGAKAGLPVPRRLSTVTEAAKPSAPTPSVTPTVEVGCDPPYVVDATGQRRYRTECFR
jgi:serine/threonine-protein kinase